MRPYQTTFGNFIYTVAAHFLQNVLKRRMKPRVIQLPITGKCNSRCIACNMWKNGGKQDIDINGLACALKDSFFSKVQSVGINGGEPSLFSNIDGLLKALFVLKMLKQVYFISNGLLSDKLLTMMETVKRECTFRGISVYLTISIDGVGENHDKMRGIPSAFQKTTETLSLINADRDRYCDFLDLGCTITRQNIGSLAELEVFVDSMGGPADYHLGVPIKRLHNFESNNFSVMGDERSRLLATEFFYGQFRYGRGLKPRLRNFLTYHYLYNRGKVRLAGCSFLRSDVTITENLDIYLCATASKKIGNLREKSASQLLREGKFKSVEASTLTYCPNCVHYVQFPTFYGFCLFLKHSIMPPAAWLNYRVRSLCQR